MIVRGKSPPLLPSSYVSVINGSDSKRHLIGYNWTEKTVDFLTLQYVKNNCLCCRYTKVDKYFYYILQINHSL